MRWYVSLTPCPPFPPQADPGGGREQSKRFFDLPADLKASLAWETPESNRGYVAQGRERVTQSTDPEEILRLRRSSPDFKETMEIGRDYGSEFRNRWPEESDLPGFKEVRCVPLECGSGLS